MGDSHRETRAAARHRALPLRNPHRFVRSALPAIAAHLNRRAVMRILYWTQHYWPHIGGVEVSAADIIPEMRRRGFEVTVVTSHGNQDLPDEDVHDGVGIHRFPFLHALQSRDVEAVVACCRRLSELKRRLRID